MTACTFWFTGLSGAGKTTIAEGARRRLESDGFRVLILDGDDIRNRLHRDLGFSEPDIKLNNTLISNLCRERRAAADAILVPIISPFRSSREAARRLLHPEFFEIYVKASIDVVAARDVKGLYARARRGELDVIGFSPTTVAYEPPDRPDLVIDTVRTATADAQSMLVDFVRTRLAMVGPR